MKPSFDLHNHRVLVTGGASGIGYSTVEAFLRCGARVAVNDLPGAKFSAALSEFANQGGSVLAAPGDIGDPDAANRMIDRAISELGGLDYLINNAGTPATSTPIAPADFDRQDEGLWNRLLNVNLLGPYRCTKAASGALKKAGGAIVNTTSVSAFGRGGSSSAYCATKVGLVALTREWARALAPHVRVNAIAPGLVESGWMCRFDETEFDVASEIPLARPGKPDEYAECIVFLAAGATYMTGQTLIVDGGMMT